ncbi:hypothetical protein [Pseudomonas sp.]|uniref:hypothetical protein n=1 Tax=Pseudomonas sp. TaxID=306 RepID=UPI003F3F739E
MRIVVPAETSEKVKSIASKPAPTGRRGVSHFIADEKKGLAKARPFLILVPRGRLELWSAGAILCCGMVGVANVYSHFYSQSLLVLSNGCVFFLFVHATAIDQRLVLRLNELGQPAAALSKPACYPWSHSYFEQPGARQLPEQINRNNLHSMSIA